MSFLIGGPKACRFAQVAKNVDETKEANNKEDKSPWKDLSTAIMEERWVDKVLERLQIHLQINIYFHLNPIRTGLFWFF